jgi:hypothetical protein
MMAALFAVLIFLSSCGGGGGGTDAEELTVPEAPTGVAAVLSGGNEVSIQWDQVPGAEYYSIYIGGTPGEGKGCENRAPGFGAAPFVYGGMLPGTYYFIVTATNATGESVPSVEVTVTVPGDPIVIPVDGMNQEGNVGGYVEVVTSQGTNSSGGGISGSTVDIWSH